jgi:hypothetical protein
VERSVHLGYCGLQQIVQRKRLVQAAEFQFYRSAALATGSGGSLHSNGLHDENPSGKARKHVSNDFDGGLSHD